MLGRKAGGFPHGRRQSQPPFSQPPFSQPPFSQPPFSQPPFSQPPFSCFLSSTCLFPPSSPSPSCPCLLPLLPVTSLSLASAFPSPFDNQTAPGKKLTAAPPVWSAHQ